MDAIDTHCHLNDPSFRETLPDVIARAREAGVGRCIVPAYDRESLERTARLTESFPGTLLGAYGLHPWFVADGFDPEELRDLLRRESTVAVGEIGLDFSSTDYPAAENQTRALILQLEMAIELRLPVLLHCRKAYDALYGILKQYRGRLEGVLHSYSGGADNLARFMELGFYISFSGAVTRSNARKYHKTAAAVPLDRALLETDAPSIATASTVASLVEPRHLIEVARKIAELRAIPLEEVCRQTTENALKLFCRIPHIEWCVEGHTAFDRNQ
jgi:TatD DNase family protein